MLNEVRLLVNGHFMTIRAFTSEQERDRAYQICAQQEGSTKVPFDFPVEEGVIVENLPDVKEIDVPPYIEEPDELFDKGEVEF